MLDLCVHWHSEEWELTRPVNERGLSVMCCVIMLQREWEPARLLCQGLIQRFYFSTALTRCTECWGTFWWTLNGCWLVPIGDQAWSSRLQAWWDSEEPPHWRMQPVGGGSLVLVATSHTKFFLEKCGESSSTDGGEYTSWGDTAEKTIIDKWV